MSAELDAIQTKLKRILGKSELNRKQWKSVLALMREHESIANPGWRDELEEFLQTLKE